MLSSRHRYAATREAVLPRTAGRGRVACLLPRGAALGSARWAVGGESRHPEAVLAVVARVVATGELRARWADAGVEQALLGAPIEQQHRDRGSVRERDVATAEAVAAIRGDAETEVDALLRRRKTLGRGVDAIRPGAGIEVAADLLEAVVVPRAWVSVEVAIAFARVPIPARDPEAEAALVVVHRAGALGVPRIDETIHVVVDAVRALRRAWRAVAARPSRAARTRCAVPALTGRRAARDATGASLAASTIPGGALPDSHLTPAVPQGRSKDEGHHYATRDRARSGAASNQGHDHPSIPPIA